MGHTWYVGVVFVTVLCGLCETLAKDMLVMEPTSSVTVVEGGTVNISCSSIGNQTVSPVVWTRDGFYVCRTYFTENNKCNLTYGPSGPGGITLCFCNRYMSVLTITDITFDDAKNWTCTSQKLRQTKHIQLVVLTNSVPTPSTRRGRATFTATTDAAGTTATSSRATVVVATATLSVTLPPAARATTTTTKDSYPKPGTLTSASSDHTSSTTSSESADISWTPGPQTISSTETWLDLYKTYIVVGAVAGGVVLLVIIVVIAVVKRRKATSGTDKKSHRQRLVKDETVPSQDEELVMEENCLYWSSPPDNKAGTMETNVQEATTAVADVYSVVQKKGGNSPDCADIYAKPDKTKKCARGDSKDASFKKKML